MKIPDPVSFEWNKGNVDKNLRKHNVSDKETEEVFNNGPLQIFADTKHSQKEQRFVAYGVTDLKRKLMIIFTLRGQKIRVISARDQSRKERRVYEETQSNS